MWTPTDSFAVQEATHSSLGGKDAETARSVGISIASASTTVGSTSMQAEIRLPPGLEHINGCALSSGLQGQEPAALHQLLGNFTSTPQWSADFISSDMQSMLPPLSGNFSFMHPYFAGLPIAQSPLSCFSFDSQPCFPKQPARPPGNWDNISLASTAAGDGASDEGDVLPCQLTPEGLVQRPSADNDLGENQTNAQVKCSTAGADVNAHTAWVEQTANGHLWVRWPVDAKKLRSKDRQIISPTIEVSPQASIKLMLKPSCTGERKGQASWKRSQGIGCVEVKFLGESSSAPRMRCSISVGEQAPRGSFEHDFADNSVCMLPKEIGQWDFRASINPESSSFLVSLQVLEVIACEEQAAA